MFLYYPLVPIFLICPLFCFLVSKNQKKKGLKWPLVNVTAELLLIKLWSLDLDLRREKMPG